MAVPGPSSDGTFADENQASTSSCVKRIKLQLINDAKDTESQEDNSDGLKEEISVYLTMKDHKESALEFWQEKEKLLPTLAQMAKVYLCLSPGSVPVESLFSTTGLILNSKRSSLDPFRCNMITFVHDNNKFLN